MATRPKTVIESHDGEKLSPITITKNVLTDDGQNLHDILSDRKEDMMTPTIENSSSMFKVGQGDNVDYSSNVVNGAYESMVLKGKTMVNCIQEPSSKDVVLPYEFADGRYVTINDTKESGALGIELKGQTLVNLVPKKIIDYTASSDWDGYHQLVQNSKQSFDEWRALQDLKPNTKYFISCYVETFEVVNNEGYRLNNPSVESIFEDSMIVNGVGRYQWLSTTKSELTDEIFMALRCQNAFARGAIKIRDIMIIEYQEGMENWDIPYFEGMTSCKMPILHTVGNNLFDLSYYGNLDNLKNTTDPYVSYKKMLKLEPNTRYRILSDSCVLPARMWSVFGVEGKNFNRLTTVYNHNRWEVETENDYGAKNSVFTTPADGLVNFVCYARHRNPDTLLQSFSNEAMFTTIMGNLRLVKDGFSTVYEPHKTSILSLPEEVVLRSLPNGVCDTFNTRTGVYTQRIGEEVLNTSNPNIINMKTAYHQNTSSLCGFDVCFSGGHHESGTMNLVSDKILVTKSYTTTTSPCITTYQDGVFVIRIPKNSDDTNKTLDEFKTWLDTENPKVQYPLAIPVTTKINLSSTLKSWNTTTHIYSEIQENTLYPTLSHSNPTYPVILKPSTKYSIVANSYSNNHTNSAINFNLGGTTASTTVGNRVTTITTPSTLSNELLTISGRGSKLNNVMVIEGDVVGDEPYFEGICDCKSPILLNVGKNLFDVDDLIKKHSHPSVVEITKTHSGFNMKSKYTGVWHATNYSMQLKPNTQYIFNCIANTKSNTGSIKLWNDCESFHVYRDVFLQNTTNLEINITFTTQKDGVVKFQLNTTRDISALGDIEVLNVSLYELTNQTTYEPYKSNTTTFEQKDDKTIVLCSLPNGVCDTLNVETGEYVQRIGEYTVNGTETSWFTYIDTTGVGNNYLNQTSCAFGVHLTGKVKGNGILCDKLPTRPIGWWSSGKTEEGVCGIDNDNRIFLRVKNEKTGVLYTDNASTALEKVKTYLASNPVTVQYELETPIVSTIDVQGFPYAYTNGHVQLSSGSIEQSLTPTVEYSVVTNRNGQIRSNQKMIERQQKQLDRLQAMILVNLVNTQYEQTLTNLKYDLKNVREEVK